VSRRTTFWLVVALAGTVLLAVVGAIVFSLLDKDGALGLISDLEDEVAAYNRAETARIEPASAASRS